MGPIRKTEGADITAIHSEFRNNLLSRRTREGGAWGLAAPLDSRVSYLAPPLSFNRNGEPRFELFT